MVTEKLVKLSKEAKDFFEKAEDNSVVLDLVISYACASLFIISSTKFFK